MKILIMCAILIALNAVLLRGAEYDALMVYTQKGNFEIGGIAGSSSGLNSRYWFTDRIGLEASAGTAFNRDYFYSLDFLYEFFQLFSTGTTRLRLFTGAGALAGYRDNENYRYVRAPVGLSMPFSHYPFTLSLFVAPAYEFAPDSKFDVNWGIAARFNFSLASRMREREGALRWRMIRVQDDYERVKDKLDGTSDELDKAIGELGRTRGELNITKGQLDKTIGGLVSAKKELDGTRSELSGAKQKLDETIGELADTKGALGRATEEIHGMKRELDTAKTRLDVTRLELDRAKKDLDDREVRLKMKQSELDHARDVIKAELEGKERAEEEKKVSEKQEELNRELERFKKEKSTWEQQRVKQKQVREDLRTKCEARRGIINEDGYCDCREHEQWNPDRSACECVKGFRLNPRTDRCEACEIVSSWGACTDKCGNDEKMVRLGKGPHTWVCVKKCRGKNEAWSERKNTCVCRDGYYRDAGGECVPRR